MQSMIYKLVIGNVTFYIYVFTDREKEVFQTWWQYFKKDPDRWRISVVLAFVKNYGIRFDHKWKYSFRFSPYHNWVSYRYLKRQLAEMGFQ